MMDVLMVVGFLALMAFSVEAKNGWWAGIKNMMMFMLCLAGYFVVVALFVKAGMYYLDEMGGLKTICQLSRR